MNNTVKYTIVAAVIIIAAAFGIQTFVGKSPAPASDLSAMTPAAGDEEMAIESSDETGSSAAMESTNPPVPMPDETTTAPAAAAEAVPPAAVVEGAPGASEPAAGTTEEQPVAPESVPSFEDEKAAGEPVENGSGHADLEE